MWFTVSKPKSDSVCREISGNGGVFVQGRTPGGLYCIGSVLDSINSSCLCGHSVPDRATVLIILLLGEHALVLLQVSLLRIALLRDHGRYRYPRFRPLYRPPPSVQLELPVNSVRVRPPLYRLVEMHNYSFASRNRVAWRCCLLCRRPTDPSIVPRHLWWKQGICPVHSLLITHYKSLIRRTSVRFQSSILSQWYFQELMNTNSHNCLLGKVWKYIVSLDRSIFYTIHDLN